MAKRPKKEQARAKRPETRTPKKRRPPTKKRGAYTLKIDVSQVEALRSIMATDEELAHVLGCSVPTIERRKVQDPKFAKAYHAGTAKGKVSVRRSLFRLANPGPGEGKPNVLAAIWLSKQYLGMRDVTSTEVSGANGAAIEVEFSQSPGERIASRLAVLAARLTSAGAGGPKPQGIGGAGV